MAAEMRAYSPEVVLGGADHGDEDDSDSSFDMEVNLVEWQSSAEEDSENELDIINLPKTPETCLQMNMVYQEVIEEKIKEVNVLLAENKEQQEKLTRELAGPRAAKSSDGKAMPTNIFLGHFKRPYFKDKTSGMGPPSNSDARDKAMQGMKPFEDLITIKWKSREKLLLRQAVVSDHLQRLLQPKLLKLDFLTDKRERLKDEMARQILTKQIQDVEHELRDINLLPEEVLLGNRLDKCDWDKIANVDFEGTRGAEELKKYWQNSEHPDISKKEWNEEEIEKLKEIAARHKCLNWEAVTQELGTQRTAFQCLQTFQANSKDFKRSEWTPEEDQMLSQLVQDMRVGSHIPYRKIAYYMEGRDSAQLIYRWTRRLDPNLKHGSWTPEEDALLLKAVAKYGERDWYKIRMEVPGRNDIQCRDRYLFSLHYDIRKGKWSKEEERKLIELTEKYGVGHWAKIALELPHRSGTQCLSKWKILLGYRKKRRKKRNKFRLKWRSESSSEDSDLELVEDSTEESSSKNPRSKAWRVPNMDLWIPTRQNLSGVPEELPSVTLLSKGFDVNRKRKAVRGALLFAENDQAPEDLQSRTSPLVNGQAKEELAVEDTKISKSKKDSWRISLAYVKCVLRRNSYEVQRRNRERSRKKRFASTSQRGLGRDLIPPAGETASSQRFGMGKMTLARRLMMAVTPWAGSMVQAWALQVKRETTHKSKAEFILKHLQVASLKSTPLFTLLLQLLCIDVGGCMKIIQKRKSRQLKFLKVIAGNAGRPDQASPAQDSTGICPLQLVLEADLPGHHHQPWVERTGLLRVCQPLLGNTQLRHQAVPSKRLVPLKAKEDHLPAHLGLPFSPPRPTPKPKTVSELLREKRQRDWRAKGVPSKRAILVPQLLLPSSVLIQHPVVPPTQTRCEGAPAASNGLPWPSLCRVGASAPSGPSAQSNLALLQKSVGDTKDSQGEETSAGSKGNGRGKECSLQKGSQGAPTAASSAPLLPKQSHLPLQVPVASLGPTSVEPGPKKAPHSAAAAHGLGPVELLPQSVALPPGSGEVTKHLLPITWLLTAQGLIPVTVVSLPHPDKQPCAVSSPGITPGLSQAAEAFPGRAGPDAAGQQLQGAFHSALQKDGQLDSTRPAVLLAPVASAELQRPLPAASPQVPLLPSASVGNVQNRTHFTQEPQSRMARNSHPAIPEGVTSPPEKSCSAPPLLQEKVTPDYRLLSTEDVAAVKEWAKGGSGPRAPLLETSLPYLPPFLCSLKTLSALLLNKATLEQTAAHLGAAGGLQEARQPVNLNAVREEVCQRLQCNPAYQLLKARFLAAFAFPAALAALSPARVTTTLSGEGWPEGSHKGDSPMAPSSSSSSSSEEEGGHRASERLEEQNTIQTDMPGVRRSTRLRRRGRHL
ncbi:snRNA-activating protein complex subunit 4 isoform X2 [Sphaerodactylus townsendi]|uniref:snRNA-activating protein complex subunit 4 isoform X2 n=1 Tax=Sphaerodactylus townsendi TaxID=933632 RepID=UPI002026BA75|nr:snRNA-activating protein complex subunit 4 isoform X2 [Sphaerodactylus townsendi]